MFLPLEKQWQSLRRSNPADFDRSPDTSVSQKLIDKVGKALISIPEGFDFLINRVEYSKKSTGKVAALSLIPPQVYTGEPIPDIFK